MTTAWLTLVGFMTVMILVIPVGASEGPAEGVGSDWMTRVQAGIRDHEYLFERGPATYRPELGVLWQAPNRALDLRLYLDDEGVEILERSADGAPTLVRLALTGWGRGEELDRRPAGALSEDSGRVERLRGGLIETYANSSAGLEFGWEIDAAPAGDGPLVFVIEIEHASARPRGGGVEIVSETGRRLLLQAARAYDRDGRALSAELVVAGRNRLELRLENNQISSPLRIKTLLTGVADHTLEANQAAASLGSVVSTAGDVNGDGFDDIIIGASGSDVPGTALQN